MQNPYDIQNKDVNPESYHNKNPDSLINNTNIYELERQIDVIDDVVIDNKINTNIEDYTMDDIFNLLGIEIDENSNYENVKNEIEKKVNNQISIFESLNNTKLVEFFKSVKGSLLGDVVKENMTEAQKLLHVYEDLLKGTDEKSNTIIAKTHDNGNVNKNNYQTLTKILSVDSALRTELDELSTDFSVDLTYNIHNVIDLKVNDIEFESNYYVINDSYESNYFWIKYNTGNIVSYLYIYIPEANYTHTSLIMYLNNYFNTNNIPIEINIDIIYDQTLVISTGTQKTTIKFKDDTDLTTYYGLEIKFNGVRISETDETYDYTQSYIFTKDNITGIVSDEAAINKYFNSDTATDNSTLFGWILGYRSGSYSDSTSYTSEAMFNIKGPRYFYLVLNDFNVHTNMNFLSSSSVGLLTNNIIARIIPKRFPFQSDTRNDYLLYSETRKYHGPVDITKLEIKLIDEYGRIVNLNGSELSFIVSMTIQYSTNLSVN